MVLLTSSGSKIPKLISAARASVIIAWLSISNIFLLSQSCAQGTSNPKDYSRGIPDDLKAMQQLLRQSTDIRFNADITVSSNITRENTRVTASFYIRQPDKFRIDASSKGRNYVFHSDGSLFTIYSQSARKYVQYPARDSILGTMYSAAGMVNLAGRLLNFFWTVDQGFDVRSAPLAPIDVGGRKCSGTRVVRFEDSFDVWVDTAAGSLPCKLISRRIDGGSTVQQTTLFTWEPATVIGEKTLSFVPPNGSQRANEIDQIPILRNGRGY